MRLVLFFLFSLLFFLTTFAEKPPAGTRISNVAVVTYEDSRGVKYRDESNPVIVVVKSVYGLDINPDFQQVTSFPGKIIDIPYSLKNTGNTQDSYILTVENKTNDDADLLNPRIYIDQNKDGKVNPGEPLYDNNSPPLLSMGETLSLIIQGQIPHNLSSGQINISLNGYSNGDNTKIDNENITVITVTPYGSLEIKKSVSKTSVNPGEDLSFLVEFTNPADNPVRGVSINTDFDNDEVPEGRTGILIYDEIPSVFSFQSLNNITVSNAVKVYKGENDNYWKASISDINGYLRHVGIFIPDSGSGALSGNTVGSFTIHLKVRANAQHGVYENIAYGRFMSPLGEVEINSNLVTIQVNVIANIVLDDTDDGENNFTGTNTPNDSDDLMIVEGAPTNVWIEVRNEVWNLGNSPEVIDITVDRNNYPLPPGTLVEFRDLDGRPLLDTNGNDYPDFGIVHPGEKKEFITRIKLPEGSYQDIIVGLKAYLFIQNTLEDEDYTFIKITKAHPSQVRVKVRTKTTTDEVLKDATLIVYEYNSLQDREPADYRIFRIDETGRFPQEFYNFLKDYKYYRIAIAGDYRGFSYTLSPYFKKDYLFSVSQEGEEKCWDKLGNEVSCDSKNAKIKVRFQNGQVTLILPLDPAGYVYDALTGERVNGACVTFYRCLDLNCESYERVDSSLLDFYPDGRTPQENPQVSGPTDVNSETVSVNGNKVKGEGGFQFTFKAFTKELEGFYFIEVTYDCNFPAANPTLAEKYQPVKFNPQGIWTPGKPYKGEMFYIDENFDQTILMAIPLVRVGTRNLVVTKRSLSSTSSIGDFIKWEISVSNPNDFTVKNIKVYDVLPKGLRYKKGSAYLNNRRFSEPQIFTDGRTLVWTIENLQANESIRISFYTVVTPGIGEGKVRNLAYVSGCIDDECLVTLESNKSFASVKIRQGIFSEKAYIIGKVFIDKNANGIQEEGEIGVQGVKIYLEDGRYVVTDSEGKYHFDNINPGVHVIKLDKESIPKGLKPIPLHNRFARDEDSVFVDLYPGDLFKVDFALIEEQHVRKTDKKYISIKRYIKEFVKDANTGDVFIKNVLIIKNLSDKPIGDVYYEEISPYEPVAGTVYLNGASYDNATPTKRGFSWNIMLIKPNEEIELTWLSYVPIKYFGQSSYTFKGNTLGEGKIIISNNIPVIFSFIKKDKYLLKISVPEITHTLKESIQAISLHLRENRNFKGLILEADEGIKKEILRILKLNGIPKEKVVLK